MAYAVAARRFLARRDPVDEGPSYGRAWSSALNGFSPELGGGPADGVGVGAGGLTVTVGSAAGGAAVTGVVAGAVAGGALLGVDSGAGAGTEARAVRWSGAGA